MAAIQLGIILFIFIIIKIIANYSIKKVGKAFGFSQPRKKIIFKIVNVILLILLVTLIILVSNIKSDDLLLYVSSVLAVLGVAFFAQWSLLSNITAAFILFFSHPMKIGDTIIMYDKDLPVEGEILDITAFFIFIRTTNELDISIPNSVALLKNISVIKKV